MLLIIFKNVCERLNVVDERKKKNLLKLYDDIYESYNINAFAKTVNDKYEKYVKSDSEQEEIKQWMKMLYVNHRVIYSGVAEALRTNDYSYLDNALYTYINAYLIKDLTLDSGYDHCISTWNLTPFVLCSKRFDILQKIYPKECGLSKNGMTFLVVATNLIMYLYYQLEEQKDRITEQTEKYLSGKDSTENKAIVAALYALMKKDFNEFSKELVNICDGRKKSRSYGENQFTKSFSFYSLGLCNLAVYLYPDDAKETIIPENDNFLKDYHIYQTTNNCPKGEYVIPLDGYLSTLKKLLDTDTPCVSLKKSGRVFVVDTQKYKQDIFDKLQIN